MVLIDTNVVSELMLAAPSLEVLAWMDDQPTHELFVTAVTEAEVRTGIALLADGARRRGLADAAERTMSGLDASGVSRGEQHVQARRHHERRIHVAPEHVFLRPSRGSRLRDPKLVPCRGIRCRSRFREEAFEHVHRARGQKGSGPA